jgi:hypothetical protein
VEAGGVKEPEASWILSKEFKAIMGMFLQVRVVMGIHFSTIMGMIFLVRVVLEMHVKVRTITGQD